MASLTLVQLSDIHYQIGRQTRIPSTAAVAEGIRMLSHSEHLAVCFTGDIAFSGKPEEYKLATSEIAQVCNSLRLGSGVELSLLTLPGNHDVDFDLNPTHERIVRAFDRASPPTRDELETLATSQTEYFIFANSLNVRTKWTSVFATTTLLNTVDGLIQLSCINTALCSLKSNSDPGYLFVSLDDVPARHPDATVHVAMLHHPLHWLNQSIRSDVTRKLADGCEVILTGHEHEEDLMTVTRRQMRTTHYIAAPALSASESEPSAYLVHSIDIPKRTFSTSVLTSDDTRYTHQSTDTVLLQEPSARVSTLSLRQSFLEEVESLDVNVRHASGRQLGHENIFVYPLIALMEEPDMRDESGRLTRIDGSTLADVITDKKHLLLVGEAGHGKTLLLRQLLKDFLHRGRLPLYLSAKTLRGRNPQDAVQSAIGLQYQQDDPAAYFRTEFEDRVLLIDDLDTILDTSKSVSQLITFANREFGSVVYACSDFALLQDPISSSEEGSSLWSLTRAEIIPMGFQKRNELITKWVNLDSRLSDDDRLKRMAVLDARVSDLVQQKVVPSEPLSVTMLLESLDGGDANSDQLGAHGFHCQRLILQALHRAQDMRQRTGQKVVTDDTALELLGRISVSLFDQGQSTISVSRCRELAIEMRDELVISFSIRDALDTLVDAGFLRERPGDTYACMHDHVVLYCVANLYAGWLNNESQRANVRQRLDSLVGTLEDDRSANVLIFFTFLVRDSETIDAIRLQAMDVFSEQQPATFGKEVEKYYNSAPVLVMPKSAVLQQERAKRAAKKDQDSSAQAANEALINKMTESGMEHLRIMRRALQCIRVLGQVLKAYPTRLSGKEKRELATEAYTVGFKSYSEFLRAVETAQELIKIYFAKISSGYVDDNMSERMRMLSDREVGDYVRLGAVSVVRRIARSVGSTSLRDLYKQVNVPGSEIGVALVNAAIEMEVLHDAQFDEIADRFERLEKAGRRVAADVLQRLAWDYVQMVPPRGAERQSFLSRMKINDTAQTIIMQGRVQKSLPIHKDKKRAGKKRKK